MRPIRDDAWMYSAMSDGRPAKNIELSSSMSTPWETAEVATMERSSVAEVVEGLPTGDAGASSPLSSRSRPDRRSR